MNLTRGGFFKVLFGWIAAMRGVKTIGEPKGFIGIPENPVRLPPNYNSALIIAAFNAQTYKPYDREM